MEKKMIRVMWENDSEPDDTPITFTGRLINVQRYWRLDGTGWPTPGSDLGFVARDDGRIIGVPIYKLKIVE